MKTILRICRHFSAQICCLSWAFQYCCMVIFYLKHFSFSNQKNLIGFNLPFPKWGLTHFSSTFCSKVISKNIFFKILERFRDFCHESSTPLVPSFKMQHINSWCQCQKCLFFGFEKSSPLFDFRTRHRAAAQSLDYSKWIKALHRQHCYHLR